MGKIQNFCTVTIITTKVIRYKNVHKFLAIKKLHYKTISPTVSSQFPTGMPNEKEVGLVWHLPSPQVHQ